MVYVLDVVPCTSRRGLQQPSAGLGRSRTASYNGLACSVATKYQVASCRGRCRDKKIFLGRSRRPTEGPGEAGWPVAPPSDGSSSSRKTLLAQGILPDPRRQRFHATLPWEAKSSSNRCCEDCDTVPGGVARARSILFVPDQDSVSEAAGNTSSGRCWHKAAVVIVAEGGSVSGGW